MELKRMITLEDIDAMLYEQVQLLEPSKPLNRGLALEAIKALVDVRRAITESSIKCYGERMRLE